MKKLWKIKVNNWGWNQARYIFAENRKEAEEIRKKFPASNNIEYAGRFRDLKADYLLGKIDQWEFESKGGK